MTTSLNAQNEKLVIAVSSRALFDLEEEHRLFEREGFAAYRTYQVEHQDVPLKPGVAFPFISRLLKGSGSGPCGCAVTEQSGNGTAVFQFLPSLQPAD